MKTKFLGIDYGLKRAGLSITDTDKIFAFPLETVDKLKKVEIEYNAYAVDYRDLHFTVRKKQKKILKLNKKIEKYKAEIRNLDDDELYEITNRTSNLDSIRIVEGICEPRASVTVWTEVSTTSFICGTEGNFSLQLGIPSNASWHKVEVTTVDLGGNTNATSIEVLYQEWLDWAIDDAEAGGPILYYGIGVVITLISVIGLTVVLVGRKKTKIRESENTLESASDWIDDIVEETAPSKPDLPPEPLPEEEELRAWARGRG